MRAADEPAARPAEAVLHLTNGGFVPGALDRPRTEPGLLRWQCPSFAAPFEFAIDGVNSVHFPVPGEPAQARRDDYCFELAGGDVLFGSLVGLDDDEAELEIAAARPAPRRASAIRRIVPLARRAPT